LKIGQVAHVSFRLVSPMHASSTLRPRPVVAVTATGRGPTAAAALRAPRRAGSGPALPRRAQPVVGAPAPHASATDDAGASSAPQRLGLVQHKAEARLFYRFLSIVYDKVVNPGEWVGCVERREKRGHSCADLSAPGPPLSPSPIKKKKLFTIAPRSLDRRHAYRCPSPRRPEAIAQGWF